MLFLLSQKPTGAETNGVKALRDFARAGGGVNRVWGALRGEYFQNAIQAGAYYIDVANDTVDTAKDKVEILPLSESGFRSIESFHEFADVAETYWKCRIIPNTFFPNLAPFVPMVVFFDSGAVRLYSLNAFMFPMNLEKRFEPAQDFVVGNDRRSDEIAEFRDILIGLMTAKADQTDSHYFDFTPETDDAKLRTSFAACQRAGAAELNDQIYKIIKTDMYLGKYR